MLFTTFMIRYYGTHNEHDDQTKAGKNLKIICPHYTFQEEIAVHAVNVKVLWYCVARRHQRLTDDLSAKNLRSICVPEIVSPRHIYINEVSRLPCIHYKLLNITYIMPWTLIISISIEMKCNSNSFDANAKRASNLKCQIWSRMIRCCCKVLNAGHTLCADCHVLSLQCST